MWLIILLLAAVITTAIWYVFDGGKYKLGTLSLILWGAAIMVFVDHLISYLEGEGFIEMTANATLLGIVLVIIALMIWEAILLFNDPKRKIWIKLYKQ